MLTQPLTVLMGVYNAQDYLREAIDSILRQTFADFTFLIINDGSSDQSAEILSSYRDKRLTVVHNPGNMGLTATLNRGLQMIPAGYVARMDADDIALPNRLEKLYGYMHAHPEVGACGSAIRHFGARNLIWTPPLTHEEVRVRLLWDNALAHPSVILRREFLQQHDIWYRKEYAHCEDYRLWTECVRKFQVNNLPDVLLDYRVHPGQVSCVHRDEQTQSLCRVMLSYLASELGIPCDTSLEHPHVMLSRCYRLVEPQALQKVGDWADDLLRTNQNQQVFDPQIFNRQLGKRWFRFCLRSYAGRSAMRRIFFATAARKCCKWYEKLCLFTPRLHRAKHS